MGGSGIGLGASERNPPDLSYGGGLCDEALSLNYVACVITRTEFDLI